MILDKPSRLRRVTAATAVVVLGVSLVSVFGGRPAVAAATAPAAVFTKTITASRVHLIDGEDVPVDKGTRARSPTAWTASGIRATRYQCRLRPVAAV
jgi:hypothetical protein